MLIRLLLCFTLLLSASIAHSQRLLDAMPRTMIAQDFTLPTVSGEALTLNDLKGKFVLVNFWSTKCTICRAELTTLEVLYDELKEENILEIVTIHAGPDLAGVNELLEISPVSYPMVMDADLTMGHWGIPSLPTSYLVTPDGNFAYRAVGSRLWNSPPMINFLREIFADYENTNTVEE